MMHCLPKFSFGEYRDLLVALKGAGYAMVSVSEMNTIETQRRACLRHDVDLFPSAALEMARRENELGAHATYYFLLSGPYNLLAADNRRLVREILGLGHEIGLHYDLKVYAGNAEDALGDLIAEVRMLERLCGRPINTISTHNPYKGGLDWFRECDRWINPYDSRWQKDLLYVSDSCRAWRDENLLRCFSSDPPPRLLLLTHPEVWLAGDIADRISYLEQVVLPAATRPVREYIERDVREIWKTHPGALAHDKREQTGCGYVVAKETYSGGKPT